MAHPRVLSVGQCGPDEGRISHFLRKTFGAEVTAASTLEQARALMRSDQFGLVLVNRIFDLDGTSGVELIQWLKGDPTLAAVPVMLVSNFPEAQAKAVAQGALPGFGKAELHTHQARERLAEVLKPSATAAPPRTR